MKTAETAAAPLPYRANRSDDVLGGIENEAIALFARISQHDVRGPWSPSPVEDRHQKLRELLLVTPGILRRFRRTFLAAGRLNFPDSPRPKEMFLEWDENLAGQKRAGALHLARMLYALHREQPFELRELSDTLVGAPTTFPIPLSLGGFALRKLNAVLGRPGARTGAATHAYVTEVQMRSLYYRKRLHTVLGNQVATVLEIGGGYGALAAETLHHLPIRQYFLVELPESVPLAFFYLKACFDTTIQVLTSPDDAVDSDARVVLLPPWCLPSLRVPITTLVNTHSFQHMMGESITYYLQQAERLRAQYLYLVNRDVKRDPTDVPISQYPFPASYTLTDRRRWVFGPAVEVVYTRTTSR